MNFFENLICLIVLNVLRIEKLDVEVGEKAIFDKVLLVSNDGEVTVGSPFVDGVKVEASVMDQNKARKIIIYKYKAKKNQRKKQGHRQPYTEVKIETIA